MHPYLEGKRQITHIKSHWWNLPFIHTQLGHVSNYRGSMQLKTPFHISPLMHGGCTPLHRTAPASIKHKPSSDDFHTGNHTILSIPDPLEKNPPPWKNPPLIYISLHRANIELVCIKFQIWRAPVLALVLIVRAGGYWMAGLVCVGYYSVLAVGKGQGE